MSDTDHPTPPEPTNPPPPEPQDPPTPEPTPPPTPEPQDPGHGDTGRLSALETMVGSLVNTVTALTNAKAGEKAPDIKPVKVPWTHRRIL